MSSPQTQTTSSRTRLMPIQPTPWVRAKGGTVNPELARIQRERLRLPGIVETLGKHR